MKITVLGTGTSQGVPVIGCTCEVCRSLDFRDKRLRTSIMVQMDNKCFVVDTGPDFRQQMLRENVQRVDALMFTHAHRDHTAGLDDVRAFNFFQNMDMPVYASQLVLDQLRHDFDYAFVPDSYPGLPKLELHEIAEAPFVINGSPIVPLPVMHLRLPVLGFRFGSFSYITDANFIPENTLQKLKGTKILILNALQIEPHISHFNLTEALKMVSIIQPEKTYLTHISHRLGLHGEVNKMLPDGVQLAYDGLEINVNDD